MRKSRPHHLHYTALPDWAQSLGMVMSLILLAPSWGGMINGMMTLSGAWHKLRDDPILRFLVVSLAFYGMSTFEGPMMAIKTSWATALITVPLVSGVPGVKLQLPLPSAVACPIGLPPPSVRITVAPASAVPLITVPLLGSSTGVAGATESTVVLAGPLVSATAWRAWRSPTVPANA